jgi:GntR family transcriptional regulator of vanillate catabolism
MDRNASKLMSDNSILTKVREMILTGVLQPGERVTEVGLAERLNVSRTPVRNVFPALAMEGLLQPIGRRGFAVKAYALKDSLEALNMRSVLEGVAAGMVAAAGPTEELKKSLLACLAEGDAIFTKRYVTADDEPRYGDMNDRFHRAIVEAANSPLVLEMYARVKLVPFAAPVTIAFDEHGLERAYELLFYAHRQHHAIVAAILGGDPSRAEFLFREHANTQRLSMWEGVKSASEVSTALKPSNADLA